MILNMNSCESDLLQTQLAKSTIVKILIVTIFVSIKLLNFFLW